jgi:cytochrome c biogenesis protein CcdA
MLQVPVRSRWFFAAALFLLTLVTFSFSTPAVYAERSFELVYYGETGCRHCDTFLSKRVPELERKYGIHIAATGKDILDPEIYEECERLLHDAGLEFRIFPVLVIGNNYYMGASEIEENLEPEILYYLDTGSYRSRTELPASASARHEGIRTAGPPSSGTALRTLPVFIAGAADGINPCAFATMLFFLSFLTLRRRRRREVLTAGFVFIAAVFVTYFGIGFGLFRGIRAASGFGSLSTALRILVTMVTSLFAALSIRDYIMMKRGRANDAVLKLPAVLTARIHRVVRAGVGGGSAGDDSDDRRTGAVVLGGIFLTGVFVSVLELACTGQVYFPTIVYMVRQEMSAGGLFLLTVYNIGFILPLVAIFLLITFGTGSDRIARAFREKGAAAKLVLAGVFVLLTAAVWIF